LDFSLQQNYYLQESFMQLKFNTIILLSVLLFTISGCTGTKIPASQQATVFYSGMVALGNFQQAVTIRGQNADNPVLIHLHGGPGYPLYPFVNDFSPLEKLFTVVYWEQRGTGNCLDKTKTGCFKSFYLGAQLGNQSGFVVRLQIS
jgi:hypothetical protein